MRQYISWFPHYFIPNNRLPVIAWYKVSERKWHKLMTKLIYPIIPFARAFRTAISCVKLGRKLFARADEFQFRTYSLAGNYNTYFTTTVRPIHIRINDVITPTHPAAQLTMFPEKNIHYKTTYTPVLHNEPPIWAANDDIISVRIGRKSIEKKKQTNKTISSSIVPNHCLLNNKWYAPCSLRSSIRLGVPRDRVLAGSPSTGPWKEKKEIMETREMFVS